MACRPGGFHGTFRTSVPGRSSVRARRQGARLRGSPTRVFPLSFSPPQPSETATTTREMEAPRECSPRPRCACSASGHTALLTQRQGGSGSPLASAPSRADQNLRYWQPQSDKPRETSLRELPKAPPPAGGWLLIGGWMGAGLPSSALTGLLWRLALSRVFSEGLPVWAEGGEGSLSGCALPVQSRGRLIPATASTLGVLSGGPDHSSQRSIGNNR